MDVKITINISTCAFDPCNDVAMKWLMGLGCTTCIGYLKVCSIIILKVIWESFGALVTKIGVNSKPVHRRAKWSEISESGKTGAIFTLWSLQPVLKLRNGVSE